MDWKQHPYGLIGLNMFHYAPCCVEAFVNGETVYHQTKHMLK